MSNTGKLRSTCLSLLQTETIMTNSSRQIATALTITIMSLTFNALSQDNYGFPVQAKTDKGVIEGLFDTRSGLSQYFGIPFAKPPVGELRWRAPQPAAAWSGVEIRFPLGGSRARHACLLLIDKRYATPLTVAPMFLHSGLTGSRSL